MRTLIIHHLETLWDKSFLEMSSKDSYNWGSLLVKELRNNNPYDQIILTQFERCEPEEMHCTSGLTDIVDNWYEYGYGWEADCFSSKEDYCEGGCHSDVVYLPDWLKDLKNTNVMLCGGFDGECIDDMETALDHVKAKWDRWEEFII